MSEWTSTTLGELCPDRDAIQTGPFGSQLHAHDYADDGVVPVIPTSAVGRAYLREIDIPRVSRSTADGLSRHYLKAGDIVFARRGIQAAGLSALIEQRHEGWLCSTGLIRLRPPHARVDSRFLVLALSLDRTYRWIRKNAVGATMPNLNEGVIRRVPLRLPPLPTQRRIAGILSAYDDLIENNTKRIKILEEMARALYREWFVHFRFPGHEKVKLVDSPLGQIPEGWEVVTIQEATENFDRKRKPLSKMQRAEMQGPFPYYGAAKVFDYVEDYLFDGRYLLCAEDGSVITKDRHPVLQLATGKFWVNNHTHILQGRPPFSTNFIYLRLNELDISPYITGAAQPKVTQTNLNRVPVTAPTADLLRLFDGVVEPILGLVDNLRSQIDVLAKTRDLLLPRLISGEIDVTNLDLPEVA